MRTRTLMARSLAGVSGLAMLAVGSTAMAQDDEEEVIVVTGFRQSLEQALELKRDETGVVDAIVAEDIADFPDLNLAESLQRIPGVAITRQAGEGRQITVRGLSGDFTRVRINGMEGLATGGGSDASAGNNRSRTFDFNAFASELFNQLVVRKSQSAEVEEGSLGANVELRTARPFDYNVGWTASVAGQALYNDLVEETSPRLAGLASYKSDDGRWGVLVSAAYQDRTIFEEGFSSVRFDDNGTFRSVEGSDCSADPFPADCQTLRDAYYARIPRYGRLTYDLERLGLTGAVQFAPTESTTITFEALHSELDAQRDEEFLQVFIRSNTDNIDVTDFAVNGDGVISYLEGDVQADASNGIIPMNTEHRRDLYTTTFSQYTATVEQEFSDRLSGTFFYGTSSSEYDNPIQATIIFDAADPVLGYSYDFRGDLELPDISYGETDVADYSEFLFTQFRNRPQATQNDFDTFRGDLEFDLNGTFDLKGGFAWKDYTFETAEVRLDGSVASLPGQDGPFVVDDSIGNLVTGFGNGLDYNGDTSWVSADWDAAIEISGILDLVGEIGSRPQDNRSVGEESLGFYAQADFDTMLGGVPVRGDIGARYVETTTSATGFLNDGSGFQEVTVENTYDDFLPALNVVAEVAEDFLLRGGVAKVMARPSLGNLTPGGSLDTFNPDPYSYSAGNPGLDPYRATAYDLSAEWYFAEESLIALSVFYKDVDSFFENNTPEVVNFSDLGLPNSVAGATSPLGIALADGQDPLVEVSQVQNGGDASIQGLEIVYQQPFSFLPAPFDKAGFTGNFTYVDSDEITDFSPISHNATLYYETERFAARISGSYRDAYQTTRPRESDGREERGVASTYNVDLSVSYQVSDQLDLTFEGINLTDEFEHQTFDRLELPTVYHHTGRNFIIGARYSY